VAAIGWRRILGSTLGTQSAAGIPTGPAAAAGRAGQDGGGHTGLEAKVLHAAPRRGPGTVPSRIEAG